MPREILGVFFVCLLAVTGIARCHAEEVTADTVLERAAITLTASNSISVEAYQREVSISLREVPGAQSDQAPYQIRSYVALTLRKQSPNDWYLSMWSVNKLPARAAALSGPMPGNLGFYMAKFGGGLGKLGMFDGRKDNTSAQENLTDDEFSRTLRSRLLKRGTAAFFPLEPLVKNTEPAAGEARLFRRDARLVGLETWKQREVYRIEGTNDMGGLNIIWIGKDSGLVERTITQLAGGDSFRSITETIYTIETGRRLARYNFEAEAPKDGAEKPTDEQMGFGPVEDLRQYTIAADGTPPGNQSRPANPVAPKAEPAAPPPPATADQQALSPEQMEGIVLIEGDEGTATGFMTQIKGVDFVVTNLHVLGTNKKITLKNLHGEIVPVLGIYGAVGSDIAILKIAKAQGTLKLADDVFKSAKIGDKIVVVGNRLGGGVATQTSGQVLGLGPTRIEVNANFESGNSGSPIFSTSTGEVIGVATYAETRRMDLEDDGKKSDVTSSGRVEKRWFGYRLDGVTKWEQINLDKWHAQSERIEKFRDLSDGMVELIRFNWKKANTHEQMAAMIGDFEAKVAKLGTNRVGVADEVRTLIYKVRSMAEGGIREFESAEYYDYYRTCLYWEESVPMQVEYRKAIVAALKKYEANSNQYLAKMRNGSGG